MRCALVTIGAAVLLAGCATNNAGPMAPMVERPGPGSPLYGPTYVERAASADRFEVESSQLALQRSQNPSIRNYAQMIINDHTNLSAATMAAAQSVGIGPMSPALLPEHAQMLQQLQAAGPGEFDAAYQQAQIAAHQQALDLHRGYSTCGDWAALRANATNAIPVLENHLNQAQGLTMMPPPPPPPPPVSGERG